MSDTRRLDLDGLRGLAVLLVVGFHAGVPALRGAFVAVDVFFVLSGFFLATSLARSLATGEGIRPAELVARRVWRLLPVLVVVLLGTLATTMLYAPIDRAGVAGHAVPVSLFAGNLAFAAEGMNYFRTGWNPLLHTWTLGIELQLVILFPLLVMLLARVGERLAGNESGAERRWIVMRTVLVGVVIAGAASFALAVAINDSSPIWAYFGPHTRLWAFGAGALMAFLTGGGQSVIGTTWMRQAGVQVAGLALLVVPALLYDGTLEYPGVIALAPVGGTMLLLAGGDLAASAFPGRMLASRRLVELGRVSFAWYLWHWPLMVLGTVLVPRIGVGGKLLLGLVGLAAAILTMRLLTRPGIASLTSRAIASRPLTAAIGVSLALAFISGSAWIQSERAVASGVQARYAAAREDDVGHGCWGGLDRRATRSACAFGSPGSSTRLVLIGDSHASHWLGGLIAAGAEHEWRIEPRVKGACPVADLRGLLTGAAARLYRDCAAFQDETMRQLAARPPRAVILANSDNYLRPREGLMHVPGLSDEVWAEGLRRTYARLHEMGIAVIVVRALPWVPFNVPSCLSRRAAGLPFSSDCAFTPDRAFAARARGVQDRAASGLSVAFVDLNDRVCGVAPGRCATERDGMVLYTDDNHITASFSRSLAPELGARIGAALGDGQRTVARQARTGVTSSREGTADR